MENSFDSSHRLITSRFVNKIAQDRTGQPNIDAFAIIQKKSLSAFQRRAKSSLCRHVIDHSNAFRVRKGVKSRASIAREYEKKERVLDAISELPTLTSS